MVGVSRVEAPGRCNSSFKLLESPTRRANRPSTLVLVLRKPIYPHRGTSMKKLRLELDTPP
jgi:hypothetical protein